MGKSVYSLALSDEIIAEVDRLAYQNGTNRSGLINSILAEYLQFTTPEQRMREVFDRMEKLLLSTEAEHPAFQLLSLPSDTMFNLRSAIRYKYNPTARYSVELYRQPEDGVFGELRVSIRTQNRNLIEAMKQFYELSRRTIGTWRAPSTSRAAFRGNCGCPSGTRTTKKSAASRWAMCFPSTSRPSTEG